MIIVFLLMVALLIVIAFRATEDAAKRGLSELQVYFIRVACVLFFPGSLIMYLILRLAARA
jgi:hypothetical protein